MVRALVMVPAADGPASPWPGVAQPGYLRPPALGAAVPAPPGDLRTTPRFPVILLDDVPLVLVGGYRLGGLPEPLAMHLDGLAGAAWRTDRLVPGHADSVRSLLTHWGGTNDDPHQLARIEGQIDRYARS